MKSNRINFDPATYSSSEFTEDSYKRLLDMALEKYKFILFGAWVDEPHILLRHDIDFSVHRSYALSKIERERDIKSTYFVHFNSNFYNASSRHIVDLLLAIKDNGHELGLHFDPSFYKNVQSAQDFEKHLTNAAKTFEYILGFYPRTVSFHLYGDLKHLVPQTDVMCGMINTYGDASQKRYKYTSDSNGVWLYDNLFDVIEKAEHPYLHVLTHPGWWTPEAMLPKQKMKRCAQGYADFIMKDHEQMMVDFKRPYF